MLLCALLAVLPVCAQSFRRLDFQDGKEVASAGLRLTLQGPDHPHGPDLWEGPLSVSHGAAPHASAPCAVDASLIHDVYLSRTGRLLVVVSISGSDTFVAFFDPRTCARKWPRLKTFTQGVRMEGHRLDLLPACACVEQGGPCDCRAGSVYLVSDGRAPQRLAAASLRLTRERLGVAFTGTRHLAHVPVAGTP